MTEKASIDPRTRLVLVFSLTSAALVFNRISFLLPLLGLSILLSLLLGRGQLGLLKRLRWLLTVFVMIALLQSLFHSGGESLLQLGGVTIITKEGLLGGVCFLCRFSVIVTSSTILVASGMRRIIQGLIQLKLPYELAFMTMISLQFIPMLGREMSNSLVAIQLRGVEFKALAFRQKVQVFTYLFMPVIVGIIVKARELSTAMEMRAFRAYNKRTSYIRLRLHAWDFCIMACAIVALAGSLYLYF